MLKPCEPVAITLPRLDVRLATYWAVGGWILLQLFQFLWHADEEIFATLAQAGGAIGGAIAFWLLCPREIELFKCLPSRNDRSDARPALRLAGPIEDLGPHSLAGELRPADTDAIVSGCATRPGFRSQHTRVNAMHKL